MVWFAVATIHGLAAAQRAGTGKAAFAVLVPVAFAFLCLCAGVGMIGLMGMDGLRGTSAPPSSTGI